jgi:hypothetical protein
MFIHKQRSLLRLLSLMAFAVLLAGCPLGSHHGPMQHRSGLHP